ncbi:MAG: hypothetical protein V1798_02105 [Pseudomonadota bacterium]
MNRIAAGLVFLALASSFACGEMPGPTIQVAVTPASALQDVNSVDLVLIVTGNSDVDQNGTADTFVYPEACGAALAAGCGFSLATAQTLNVGRIPLGSFTFQIEARIRDSSGVNKYTGTVSLPGDGSQTAVTITVAAVTS